VLLDPGNNPCSTLDTFTKLLNARGPQAHFAGRAAFGAGAHLAGRNLSGGSRVRNQKGQKEKATRCEDDDQPQYKPRDIEAKHDIDVMHRLCQFPLAQFAEFSSPATAPVCVRGHVTELRTGRDQHRART
jgi:hypothetical protein